MDLEILQINSDALEWDNTLHGVFTGGNPENAPAILSETRITTAPANETEQDNLRRFVYSFVEKEPDASYGGSSYDVGELRDILHQIENAVYLSMTGVIDAQKHLRDVGAALTVMLLPNWLINRLFGLPEGTPLVIRVDDIAACIPWELCYSLEHQMFLGKHLAISRGVTVGITSSRRAKPSIDIQKNIPLTDVACMINPEGDPGLEDCATTLDNLIIDLQKGCMAKENLLKSDIGGQDLQIAMGSPFFHYTGHIRFDPQIGSYILCSDGIKIDTNRTAKVIDRGVPPKLTFLNACRSDIAPDMQIKPGQSATQTSFVQQFYRRGTLSVIGTRWEVDIKTAQAADRHFFTSFKRSATPVGEVMRQFRQSDIGGWPCYVLYGDPRIRFELFSPPPSPQPTCPQVVSKPRSSSNATKTLLELNSGVATVSQFAIRKPWLRAPQYIAILVENSGYVQERPEILEVIESFLQSVTIQAHKLNASVAPHGGGFACGIRVRGYSNPLDGVLSTYGQPELHRNWRTSFAPGQKWLGKKYSLSRVLKEVYGEFKRFISHYNKQPLPAPIVIICAANGSNDQQRDTNDAIRICKDLRQLILPGLDIPERTKGTTVKTAVLGFGSTIHDSYLRGLAGTEPNGNWWRLHNKEEIQRFAEKLCYYLLIPTAEEPFALFCTEHGS
jgi:hypothetical protein